MTPPPVNVAEHLARMAAADPDRPATLSPLVVGVVVLNLAPSVKRTSSAVLT